MKAISFINKHRLISLIVVFQIIFIAFLLYSLPKERCTQKYKFKDNCTAVVDDDIIYNHRFKLCSGAYDIKIKYTASNLSKKTVDKAVMKITSDSKPLSVENDSIALSNRDNEVSNRIWLSFGGGTNDIALSFKTNKSYVLNSVEFTEILKYRFLRIIGYLFLFFLIDVLIFVFSSNKISQKTKLTLFSLLAISLFCSLIEFSDTISYTSDGRFHLNRILSLADALNGGYFPVRLHYLLLNGYGFANPIFYCDIFLYPSAILYNCGAALLFTYKLYVTVINTATAFITYFVLKKIYDNKSALLGTALYTLAAYRVICIARRGSVGEYTAMLFLPLVFYGMYRIYTLTDVNTGSWRDWLPLCAGLSGIVMSHILSTEMTAIFLSGFCIYNFNKTFKRNRFVMLSKAVGFTLLTCAWFIVPFIDYSRYQFRYQFVQNAIQKKGLTLAQIFALFFPTNSYPLLLGGAFLAAAALFIYLLISKKDKGIISKSTRMYMAIGCIAVFISSRYFPWEQFRNIHQKIYQLFATVQFPWRYLFIANIAFTLVAVSLYAGLRQCNKQKTARVFAAVLMFFCIIPTSLYFSHITGGTRYKFYCNENLPSSHVMSPFYLPEGTDEKLLANEEVSIAEGDVVIEKWKESHHRFTVDCNNSSASDASIQIPVVNFKGYKAYDLNNNKQLEIVNGSNNVLWVKIPSGYSGKFKVEFCEPWYWRVSEIVSLLTLVSIITFTATSTLRRRNSLSDHTENKEIVSVTDA